MSQKINKLDQPYRKPSIDISKRAYEKLMNQSEEMRLSTKELSLRKDEDLVIEGNAVYEIDRDCANHKGKCYKAVR